MYNIRITRQRAGDKINNRCFILLFLTRVGGRGVRGNNGGGGANAETVIRSPTTKTPMALPTEPKTYVAVDMQQPAV